MGMREYAVLDIAYLVKTSCRYNEIQYFHPAFSLAIRRVDTAFTFLDLLQIIISDSFNSVIIAGLNLAASIRCAIMP